MGRPNVARQRRLVHGETVILAADHHPPGGEILDGMIRAVVPELHLHRRGAGGQAEDLVAEADSEHGHAPGQQLARRVDGGTRCGIDRRTLVKVALIVLSSLVGSALSRTDSNLESVLTFRVSQLRIHTDPVQKLVVDGEILEAESVEFRCLPGSLRVIAPLTVA